MHKLKKKLRIVRCRLRALKQYCLDYTDHIRYFTYYHPLNKATKDMLRCRIMLLNHQLEKAQTYPIQKQGYGKEKIVELMKLVDLYTNKFGYDEIISTSIGVMNSHFANPNSFKTERLIDAFRIMEGNFQPIGNLKMGGVIKLNPLDLNTIDNLYDFLQSRRSCRTFSDEPIDSDSIRSAVMYAMTAPSACNRQCVRAHYYEDKDKIRQIIESQKSDIGWCLGAKGLFVITANKSVFRDYVERNQKMFDAGLFSMLLVLGLQNQKIGSCFKMAQKDWSIEKETHKIADIPQEEDICVLLMVGKFPKEEFVCAKSSRLDINAILKSHAQ